MDPQHLPTEASRPAASAHDPFAPTLPSLDAVRSRSGAVGRDAADEDAESEDSAAFAASVAALLTHYARTERQDPGLLVGLQASYGDLGDLVARGTAHRFQSAEPEERHTVMVRTLPGLWRLEEALGLSVLPGLAVRLDDDARVALQRASLGLVAHLDESARPAAWEAAQDTFLTLMREPLDEDDDLTVERSRLLARGVTGAVALAPDRLASALDLVETRASRPLLRALATDPELLGQDRFLGALLLRGGPRSLALGAAMLAIAPDHTVARIRDFLAVAPPGSLVRLAEAHGLLSLLGDDGAAAADALRTAFLTHVWQSNSTAGLPWWRAFRGEHLVASCIGELGDAGLDLCKDAAGGMALHLRLESPLRDPIRRDAIATCLARVVRTDRFYVAAFRLAEGRLRELGRHATPEELTVAVGSYVAVLLQTARQLMSDEPDRDMALSLLSRALRTRHTHRERLVRDVLPETAAEVLDMRDTDRAARRWLRRELMAAAGLGDDNPLLDLAPAPTAGVVTTADAVAPLPGVLGIWAGARRHTVGSVLGGLMPLPLRHAANALRRLLGCTAKARFTFRSDGSASVEVRRRLLGLTVRKTTRAVDGGHLITFPAVCLPADRLLGRWSAAFLAASTIGSWLVLSATDHLRLIGGAVLAGAGILTYLGALGLHRVVKHQNAVAVRDDRGRLSVWRVRPETGLMLQKLQQTEQTPG